MAPSAFATRLRLAAFDVHYEAIESDGAAGQSGECAWAAALVFESWESAAVIEAVRISAPTEAGYEPGAFYKRELGPLLACVRALAAPLDLAIVDGYATLGVEERPGLGWRLWDALGRGVPVIGVAKTRYRDGTEASALRRGRARTPLFVTAVGVEPAAARAWIAAMHGPHRLPTLLRRVDQLSRGLITPDEAKAATAETPRRRG